MTRFYLYLLLLLCFPSQALTVHQLISDGVVLQRNQPIPVKGTTNSQYVSLWLNDKKIETISTSDNQWIVTLPPQPAGGPFTLTIKADEERVINDVYFGDVYLASGQSNMELTMARIEEAYPDDVNDANFPLVREFTVADTYRFDAENSDYAEGQWLQATPENIRQLSAVAYYFARHLHLSENVPIGIINAALGGSPIEAWMAKSSLKPYPQDIAAGEYYANPDNIKTTKESERKAQDDWYKNVNANDKGLQGTSWFSPELNDGNWENIDMPGNLPGFNSGFAGVWWLRKHVHLNDIPDEPVILRLGRIVDADEAYVNGVKVGNTTYQYPPRRYTVPKSALKKGDNIIAIRVISNGGNSGFITDKPYFLGTDEEHSVSLEGTWQYKVSHQTSNTPSTTFIRWKPMGLFNAMIAPAAGFPLSGVLWYQGESNASRPADYSDKLTAMMELWRSRWQQPSLPFFIVQLTNFMQRQSEPVESSWAELREQQAKASNTPNTALIVTIDIGEWNDIHPVNKREVGRRLALAAKNMVYQRDVSYQGPKVLSVEHKDNRIVLTFDSELDKARIEGDLDHNFAAAGMDDAFFWVKATVNGNQVYLQHPSINKTVKLRYAWGDNPAASLYNREGLPVAPFELIVSH